MDLAFADKLAIRINGVKKSRCSRHFFQNFNIKVLQFKYFKIYSTLSETNTACAMRAIQFESIIYIVILKIMFKICSQIATTGFSSEL